MMYHEARVKVYDAMQLTDNERKFLADAHVTPEVARIVIDRFEWGEEPRRLGVGLGGSAVVYSILRAAIRGLRSHNMLARPIFATDGFGRPITAIPAASERRLRERRAA